MEPLHGNGIPRLIQSTHHLEAQALAKIHRLYFIKLNLETGKLFNIDLNDQKEPRQNRDLRS